MDCFFLGNIYWFKPHIQWEHLWFPVEILPTKAIHWIVVGCHQWHYFSGDRDLMCDVRHLQLWDIHKHKLGYDLCTPMRYNTCLKWLSPGYFSGNPFFFPFQATMKHQGRAAQPNISKTKREKQNNSCKFPSSILQSWKRWFSASWIFFRFSEKPWNHLTS